ncbi:MAG: oxygen-independent coproporphyrinogen III oxidase, partial [Prevotella sp.]|nr:oxygen-independent coproporphyrinogen III oxidase [Prevotella sp.]
MQQSILNKYNVPVPRYTSYPPANYFRALSEEEYISAVRQSNSARDRHLSFYLHIPFCRSLCHYCACNSYAMRSEAAVADYVRALYQEIDLVVPLLQRDRQVAQIHYGGGSPTSLQPAVIKSLNQHILTIFPTIDRPEVAIECHPGYLSLSDWNGLVEAGFSRFSIGVQDFDEEVLKTVNRRPSQERMQDIFDVLRDGGAHINLDFLYGLPHQTAERFCQSIEQAIELQPDRLVMFSYAHVPWLKKRQLILEKAGLPATEEKERMFDEAARLLLSAGYVRVGMDHFVRPDDELYTALQDGRLHRNFQGYCTRRTTAQVYALGVTGISQLETAYA